MPSPQGCKGPSRPAGPEHGRLRVRAVLQGLPQQHQACLARSPRRDFQGHREASPPEASTCKGSPWGGCHVSITHLHSRGRPRGWQDARSRYFQARLLGGHRPGGSRGGVHLSTLVTAPFGRDVPLPMGSELLASCHGRLRILSCSLTFVIRTEWISHCPSPCKNAQPYGRAHRISRGRL